MKPGHAKSSSPAIAAAVVAAIGASACCVLPLLLVLLGVGGAWMANLTALDAWRPWFIAATAVFLVLAFRALYGSQASCETDAQCVDPHVLRRRRRWLWLATILIACLLLFPYYVAWFL